MVGKGTTIIICFFQMDKKTSLNMDWLNNPTYKEWIARDENQFKAKC